MKKLIFLLLMAFSRFLYAGEPTQELDFFTKGNQAYQSGNYAEAINLYELAFQNGQHAAELYENLGNAYFKQNQFGKSILNYEKGLLLSPNSKSIHENLDFVKNKMNLSSAQEQGFFLTKRWIQLCNFCSPNTWAILLLLISFLTTAAFALLLNKKYNAQYAIIKKSFYVLLPLLLLSFFAAQYSANYLNNSQQAIIIAKNTTLFTDPDPKTEAIEMLSEGSKIILIDQIGAWTKAQLLTGEEGWLESGTYIEVRF
jgi:tetratricopeptide (TPR) repeat protein